MQGRIIDPGFYFMNWKCVKMCLRWIIHWGRSAKFTTICQFWQIVVNLADFNQIQSWSKTVVRRNCSPFRSLVFSWSGFLWLLLQRIDHLFTISTRSEGLNDCWLTFWNLEEIQVSNSWAKFDSRFVILLLTHNPTTTFVETKHHSSKMSGMSTCGWVVQEGVCFGRWVVWYWVKCLPAVGFLRKVCVLAAQ